jgi:transcription antitermination factor NusG
MEIATTTSTFSNEPAVEAHFSTSWYAVYTWARHEKRVKDQLDVRQIRCALPLYRVVRRWSDRRKEVELPLFPSYIFVQLPPSDRVRVLEIPGVVSFVSLHGKPLPLPQDEIGPFLCESGKGIRLEPHPYLQVGRNVRLRSGAMAGWEGTLLRKKEGLRLVISMEMLMRSVAVEVDATDVEPCHYRSTVQSHRSTLAAQ